MPTVNLSALTPFDKNKIQWVHFYKENILSNLMANGLNEAVLTDFTPALPIPAVSNALQDQRDFIARLEKYNEAVKNLTEKLSIAYAIVCKLITTPQTRSLVRLADESVPMDVPFRLRLVINHMLVAMREKYANQQLSDNASLIGKWNSFRWSYRYGFNPMTAADPTDCSYHRIEDFSTDWQTAVEEYSVYDPDTTGNQVGLQQTLLNKLREYPGITDAIKVAAVEGSTDMSILQMLIRQEALSTSLTPTARAVNAAFKKPPQKKFFAGQGKANCYNCGGDSHYARDCRKEYCKKCESVLVMWYCHHVAEGKCKILGKRVAAAAALTDVKEETEEEEEDDSKTNYTTFSTGNLFNQIQDYFKLLFSYLTQPIKVGVVRKVAAVKATGQDTILLDSGADISILSDNTINSCAIRQGATVSIQGINGRSTSSAYVDVGDYSFLYMPAASESVISVREIVEQGHTVTFSPGLVQIIDQQGLTVVDKYHDGLCFLSEDDIKVLRAKAVINEYVKTTCMKIHLRQGHASTEAMCRAIDAGAWVDARVTSTEIRAVFRYDPCIDCAIAKIRRGNKGHSDGIFPRVGAVISFDWVSCTTISLFGDVGFFYMVDIGTGAIYAYPSKSKSAKEFKRILTHHLLLMTQAGHIVTTIHSDMGSTETSAEVREVLQSVNIKAEECNVRRQENNTVESYVRICTRGVAAILVGLPWHNSSLWPYALVHFCDVNRTIPNFKSGDKSPAQILYNKVVHCNRNFMYPYGTIVVCVFDKNTRYGRRDTFENGLVGFVAGYNHDKINDDGIIIFLPSYKTTEIFKHSDVKPLSGTAEEQVQRLNIVALDKPTQVVPAPGSQRRLDLSQIERTVDRERQVLQEREAILQDIRRQENETDVTVVTLRACNVTNFPNKKYIIETEEDYRILVSKRKPTSSDSPSIRTIMKDADLFVEWQQALSVELAGLEYESLEYIPEENIPHDADIYDSMMITTTKRSKRDNSIERRKCRLVVRGDQQQKLLIDNIFSPTVSRQSFLLLIILAVQYNLVLTGFDVTQAFLNSSLDGVVFIRLPRDLFLNGNQLNITSKFAQLKRSVYGLKEAPRLWYDNITAALEKEGFKRLKSDICMYDRGTLQCGNKVLIALTVDDGAIAASTQEIADKIFAFMEKQYTITKQEDLTTYAGFTIDKLDGGYKVSQTGYISNLPSYIHSDFMDCYNSIRSYKTPIDEDIFSDIDIDCRQPTEREYKSLIGAIIYTLPTQPGINFAVSILASRAQSYKKSDYIRLLRLVKYLHNNSDGIIIRWSANFTLNTFCDSSWLLDPENSTSYYCYVIRLGNNILSMTAKKIKGIMLSSTEAEQYSILEVGKAIVYWRNYLQEVLYEENKLPTPIYQDNQSAITICKSIDKNFKKVKYFLLRINKVNELIEDKIVEPIWLNTVDQLADIGTKPTSPARYKFLNDRICGHQQFNITGPLNVESDDL